MKASRWLRAAAVLLALFFLGHTAAVLLPAKSSGPQEDAVLQAMKGFHFDAMGRDRTIWDFWQGFNFFTSVALAILVVLTWQLAGLARQDPARARPFALSLGIGLAAMAWVCWRFFFVAPAGTSTLAAACAFAAWISLRSARAACVPAARAGPARPTRKGRRPKSPSCGA